MSNNISKILAVAVAVSFVLIQTPSIGAEVFIRPKAGDGKAVGAEVGFRMPFGKGAEVEKENLIENLKNEDTKGAGTALAIIFLGACIVGAAIIIANQADDSTDEIVERADELDEEYRDVIDELEEEYENRTSGDII